MKPLSLDKLISNPVDGLSVLAPLLIEDRQIKETENLENLYKNLIKHISSQNDQELKFLVAKTQKDIGFILKYKSYGIKASIPIGFSLFFLEPREGFKKNKENPIGIDALSSNPGHSFAFVCTYSEWQKKYKGEINSDLDIFKFIPESGDILQIGESGIVHTVFGCVMEEYANISTDVVDRLHDQNKDRSVPDHYNRQYFNKLLKKVVYPLSNNLVSRQGDSFTRAVINWQNHDDISELKILQSSDFEAKRILIPNGKYWNLHTNDNYVSLFLTSGSAKCEYEGRNINLGGYEILFCLPYCNWTIQNTSGDNLEFSMIKINKSVALR